MYLWRCVFVVGLGLVWYFWNTGILEYFSVQVFCCALSFLLFFLCGGESGVCDSCTQTDCATEEATSQQEIETDHVVGRDSAVWTEQKVSHQSQYPNIQRSLQHIFKCAYTYLVLPWSTAPEPGDSQPLHTALLTEFNLIMNEIICKAQNLDLLVTSLGCIQIFTQHLHKSKQSDGSPAFTSKAEEIALIRGFCKALIQNLFPKHLWEPNVYYCALQEILAMKVLALVTLLSDPENLNYLIISKLEQMPLENPVEEVHDSDRESPSLQWSENNDVMQDEAEVHTPKEGKAKKKGKKLRESFSKFLDAIHYKKGKLKRKKKEVAPTRCSAVAHLDDRSSNEGSICESVDTDAESLTSLIQEEMMEFKLSYEIWRVGSWRVTVTNVQEEGNELCFTVHLEDINNSTNLHWDVKKNKSNIIQFYNQCKEVEPQLSSLTILEKTECDKEEAKSNLEQFLQELVNNSELGNSKFVFQFLGPMDWILHEEEHDDGLWALLGEIASFLTSGHDDEPSNAKGEEKQHEVSPKCNTSEVTPQHEPEAIPPACTETFERQVKETKDKSVVSDKGHLLSPEQTFTGMSENQHTGYTAQPIDQPEVNAVDFQNLSVDLSQIVVRKKYPKFESNFKREPAALKSPNNDEDSSIHCTNNTVSISNDNGNVSKEETNTHRTSSETDTPERKEKTSNPDEETLNHSSGEKRICSSSEKLEANKVIFDLLKEICGNSYTFIFLKTVVTPFTPLINKKVNAFLQKMNPSEAQIATCIDSLCESIWPEKAVPQPLPQSSDNKNKIKQKAMQIMTSKFAGFAIINKTNIESIFKIFQNAEENKKLVYMLLTYLLRKFLPAEPAFGQ